MSLQLDGSGGNLRIIGVGIPVLHLSFDADAVLLYQTFQQTGVPHDYLQHAIHVPKVYEGYTAVIPDILHPSGHLQSFSHIFFS